MTTLSLIMGGIVLAYTIAYAVKSISPIMRYQKCEKEGEIKIVDGSIFQKNAEANKAFRGEMINLCLPKFEYEVKGKKRYYQSTVRYQNASVGQSNKIGYCERTGEAWVITDIPLMKKELTMRMITMLAILLLLLATEVML